MQTVDNALPGKKNKSAYSMRVKNKRKKGHNVKENVRDRK
jgi:hypothetical protein